MKFQCEQNEDYIAIWRRYLVDWCRMPQEDFVALCNDLLETPNDVLRHEEPFYYIYAFLIDTCGKLWPPAQLIPTGVEVFNRSEWFAFGILRKAILHEGAFDEWSASDDQWNAAKSRADTILATYGFRLVDYSKKHQ